MGQEQWCGDAKELSILKQSYLGQSYLGQDEEKKKKNRQIVKVPEVSELLGSMLTTLGKFIPKKDYPRGTLEPPRLLNNCIYHGEWWADFPSGLGRMYFADGSLYEGFFNEGLPHGEGRFICTNGVYYEGDVEKGEAEGLGTFVNYHKAYSLYGYWSKDVPHGKCREVWGDYPQSAKRKIKFTPAAQKESQISSFALYEGPMEYGVKKGKGKYECEDYIYEGHFINNEFCGKGKIIFKNNESYEGDFCNNNYQGVGKYKWEDGCIYEGKYFDCKKNGEGIFIASNGVKTEGIYEMGVVNKS